MRLSTVFELLLIFLLIAFAAYGRVIDRNEVSLHRVTRATKQTNFGISILSLKQATDNVNKYCKCNNNVCNCCRNFHIPIVRLQGPGCASLQYLKEDNLAVQLSFGENILGSTVFSGKKPRAICVPMPGGLSKFCGRIYSIEREANNHFKACLGLELESPTELEASLRVSCFRFGPEGLQLRPAEPLPIIEAAKPAEEDDDDDYDLFGLDDDDLDSDEDSPPRDTQNNSPAIQSADDDDDDDDDDLGFDAFVDFLTGDDESEKKKATTVPPTLPFTIPLNNKPIPVPTIEPAAAQSSSPVKEGPVAITKKPAKKPESTTASLIPETSDVPIKQSTPDDKESNEETTYSEIVSTEAPIMDHPNEEAIEDSTMTDSVGEETVDEKTSQPIEAEATEAPTVPSEAAATDAKPVIKTSTIKKIVGIKTVKKPSLTQTSINAITTDTKKPAVKPTKPDPVINVNGDEDDDDDDYALASDEDDDADSELEAASVEADAGDEYDDDDESEEEEEAVLTALVSDDDKENTKDVKLHDNEASKPEDDDADYGMGLAELLARKRKMRSGRQSKVMRL